MQLVCLCEPHLPPLAKVFAEPASEQPAELKHGKCVPVEGVPHLFDLLIRADQLQVADQADGGFEHQLVELVFRLRRETVDVGQMLASGDDAQALILLHETLQECFQSLILQPTRLPGAIRGRVLQGFDAVEHEQRFVLANEPGQPFTAFPRGTFHRVGVAEEGEGVVNEQVGRGLA